MPGRTFTTGTAYRYGFNGKENDKDISEGGQDYGMRISDNRLGRFLSVDPITNKYPQLTPYQFASNTPLCATDLDGLEADFSKGKMNKINYEKSTPWYIQPDVFWNNVGVSMWNGTVDGAQDVTNIVISEKGRHEVAIRYGGAVCGAIEWANTTSPNQKIQDLKNHFSNPSNVEDAVGVIASLFVPVLKKAMPNPIKAVSGQLKALTGLNKIEGILGIVSKSESLVKIGVVEGDVMMFSSKIGEATIEGITNFAVKDGKLYLNKLHLQGSSAGNIGRKSLWDMAKDLGRQYNVKEVIIQGGKRTTGKYKGQIPSPITIKVD